MVKCVTQSQMTAVMLLVSSALTLSLAEVLQNQQPPAVRRSHPNQTREASHQRPKRNSPTSLALHQLLVMNGLPSKVVVVPLASSHQLLAKILGLGTLMNQQLLRRRGSRQVTGLRPVCKPGMVYFDGSCYKFFPNLVTIDQAWTQCSTLDEVFGVPVSIESKEENDFITGLTKGTESWTAHSAILPSNPTFQISFANWAEGEPRRSIISSNGRACVYVAGGKWRTEGCNFNPTRRASVCELPYEPPSVPDSRDTNAVDLPDGNRHVIRMDGEDDGLGVTTEEAMWLCHERFADLMTFYPKKNAAIYLEELRQRHWDQWESFDFWQFAGVGLGMDDGTLWIPKYDITIAPSQSEDQPWENGVVPRLDGTQAVIAVTPPQTGPVVWRAVPKDTKASYGCTFRKPGDKGPRMLAMKKSQAARKLTSMLPIVLLS